MSALRPCLRWYTSICLHPHVRCVVLVYYNCRPMLVDCCAMCMACGAWTSLEDLIDIYYLFLNALAAVTNSPIHANLLTNQHIHHMPFNQQSPNHEPFSIAMSQQLVTVVSLCNLYRKPPSYIVFPIRLPPILSASSHPLHTQYTMRWPLYMICWLLLRTKGKRQKASSYN